MIDLQQETLIEISEVPRLLPRRASGKRIHISAVHRWVHRGVRGVQLESILVGRTRYTSLEAVERFSATLSRGDIANSRPVPVSVSRQRQREKIRAADEAAAILGQGRGDSASACHQGPKPTPHGS